MIVVKFVIKPNECNRHSPKRHMSVRVLSTRIFTMRQRNRDDRANALVVADAVRGGWWGGEVASRSFGLWWVEVGYRICLQGLWSREALWRARYSCLQVGAGSRFQWSQMPWEVFGDVRRLFPSPWGSSWWEWAQGLWPRETFLLFLFHLPLLLILRQF